MMLNRYFCSMEVTGAMIDKLATLARLRFNEEEKESIKNDLQKMIAFVQKMDEVDTTGVEPLLHMSDRTNVWRADEVNGSCSQQDALKNAANHNDDFFLVPKIIQK